MAQYTPSFVDTSGFTNAINEGILQVAQIHQKQDQLVQAQIDDFKKNYNPNKLRDDDLPVFTNAFNNYKNAALRYSRLNRAGAKPEEIALANSLKDKALNEMNSLYSNSVKASRHLDEYSKAIETAKMKGYAIPTKLNDTYMTLANNGIDKIDVEKIPSAWSFDFTPKEIDLKKLTDYMDAAGGHLKEKGTEYTQGRLIGKTASGQPLYAEKAVTIASRNPNIVTQAIDNYAIAHPEVHNAAKMAYDDLISGIKNNNQQSINKFNLIKSELGLGEDATPDKLTPSQVYGSQFYMPVVTGSTENLEKARLLMQTENERYNRANKAKTPEAPSYEHPSTSINSIVDAAEIKRNEKGLLYDTPYNVSRQFGGYSAYDATTGMKGTIDDVTYHTGNNKNISPYFRYSVNGVAQKPLSPDAFNKLIVTQNADISFKGGSLIKDKAPTEKFKGKVSTPISTPIKKGGKYTGLDDNNNPIFE